MELSHTPILPIIRQATKTVIGAYDLGKFVAFDGTETSYQLPSTHSVNIVKWTHIGPHPTEAAPWFMAVVLDDATFKSGSWEGYSELLRLKDMPDHTRFVAAQGLPNRMDYTPGTLISTMSSVTTREQPPLCNILPTIAVTDTNTKVTQTTGGTWKGLADNTPLPADSNVSRQWFLETGVGTGVYSAVAGQTAVQLTLSTWTGRRIYAKVNVTDDNGSIGTAQTTTVTAP